LVRRGGGRLVSRLRLFDVYVSWNMGMNNNYNKKKGLDKSNASIAKMFDGIAREYDALDHILSVGADIRWRRRLVRELKCGNWRNGWKVRYGKKVLDLACGTGDLTLALCKAGYEVTGVDISEKMMAAGRLKCRDAGVDAKFVLGSAEALPFEDESFDVVTISFGIRNFDNRDKCLSEIFRVLKPGGRLMILEFAVPRFALWRWVYLLYFKFALPIVGGVVSRKMKAYQYLPSSVLSFPQYGAFSAELVAADFVRIKFFSLSGGIAVLYTAVKM